MAAVPRGRSGHSPDAAGAVERVADGRLLPPGGLSAPPGLRHRGVVLPQGTAAGLFRFVDGDPRHVRAAMELGLLPWWTDPGLKAIFFRPLAALTHALDYRLWPGSALLMHAHSLAWFGALVLAAALFYQRLLGRSITAGLAALLFAVDSAHGTPVGWLANRNSLLAAFFGVLTLLAYDRLGAGNQVPAPRVVHPGRLAVPLLLALKPALRGSRHRDRRLSPRARPVSRPFALAVPRSRAAPLAGGGDRLARARAGAGGRHAGHGAVRRSGASPAALPRRHRATGAALMLGQWTPIPAEISFLLTRAGVWTSRALAVVMVTALALCLRPLLRRDPLARFFAAGMCCPCCRCAPPSSDNRLLISPAWAPWACWPSS